MSEVPLGDSCVLVNVIVHAVGTHTGQWGAHKAPCGAEGDHMIVASDPAQITCFACRTRVLDPTPEQRREAQAAKEHEEGLRQAAESRRRQREERGKR